VYVISNPQPAAHSLGSLKRRRGDFDLWSFPIRRLIYWSMKFLGKLNGLPKDRLVLALVAEVAREALAETRGVVADAAAGAVAPLLVAVAEENVGARGALLEGAVGAAEAEVAHAAHVLHRVPRRVVDLASLHRELLLGVADAAAGAVVGAHGALARDAVVVLEALALARLPVAQALVAALDLRVHAAAVRGHAHPGSSTRTRALRAVGAVVLGVARDARVARADVVGLARTVGRALVGAQLRPANALLVKNLLAPRSLGGRWRASGRL